MIAGSVEGLLFIFALVTRVVNPRSLVAIFSDLSIRILSIASSSFIVLIVQWLFELTPFTAFTSMFFALWITFLLIGSLFNYLLPNYKEHWFIHPADVYLILALGLLMITSESMIMAEPWTYLLYVFFFISVFFTVLIGYAIERYTDREYYYLLQYCPFLFFVLIWTAILLGYYLPTIHKFRKHDLHSFL
jgi:hypothetical protein